MPAPADRPILTVPDVRLWLVDELVSRAAA
jgi:hypothetical protein